MGYSRSPLNPAVATLEIMLFVRITRGDGGRHRVNYAPNQVANNSC